MSHTPFTQIASRLEAGILAGSFPGKLPGLHRLAREYGANHLTVAKAVRALEAQGLVKVEGTRGARICGAKTRPRHGAIALVGVVLANRRQMPHLDLVERLCLKTNRELRVLHFPSQRAFEGSAAFLTRLEVDGLIFQYARPPEALARALRTSGLPFLTLAPPRAHDPSFTLDADHLAGYRAVVAHFQSLGHERLAFIVPQSPHPDIQQGLASFCQSPLENKEDSRPVTLFSPSTTENLVSKFGGEYQRHFGEMAARHFLAPAPAVRPTAVYIHAPNTARALIEAFEKKGLTIPKHLSVIAGAEGAETPADPKLSTLEHPRKVILRRAVTLLLAHLDKQSPLKSSLLPRRLVLRKSTAPCPR